MKVLQLVKEVHYILSMTVCFPIADYLFDPTVTCEDLPMPANVRITYNNAASPRPQGTVVVQTCVNGYSSSSTSSSSTTRTCQSDRQWSGVALVCDCK